MRRRRPGNAIFNPAEHATSQLNIGGLAGADGITVASVPDAFGGSAATQSTDAQRPVLGTSGNGKRILVCTNETMVWPLQAARNNQTAAWWLALWYRPTNLVGTKNFYNVNTQSGGATAVRSNCQQAGDELVMNVFDGTASNARRGITTSDPLVLNVWCFLAFLFSGAGGTEAERCRILLNCNQLPLTFAANPTTSSMPTALQAPTGNAWLFGTSGGGGPLTGEIGPQIWTGEANPSPAVLAQFQDYDIPTL